MIGFIASEAFAEEIKEGIQEEIYFEKIGNFDSLQFIQHCQAAANVSLQTIIIDMNCCEDEGAFIKGIRTIRTSRNVRIILVAAGKVPGDPVIAVLVGLQVWDIIAPAVIKIGEGTNVSFETEDSITPLIEQCVNSPVSYGNALRWDVKTENIIQIMSTEKDTEQKEQKKQKKPVQAFNFDETIVDDFIKPKGTNIRQNRRKDSESERIYQVLPNKTIIVGSLYPGAGSSFVIMSLARILNYLEIPNAVVESPVIMPELYSHLYGDKYAPRLGDHELELPYNYLSDQVLREGRMASRKKEWNNGTTLWFPANPDGNAAAAWTYELTIKMLLTIKSPIILYDVSTYWDHPSVSEICLDADDIIFVSDSMPSKLDRPDAIKNTSIFADLKIKEKSVHVVANRDVDSKLQKDRSDWLQSLPDKPICTHPYVPYKEIIESIWKETLIQDQSEMMQKLMTALMPLIRRIVPDSYPIKPFSEKRSGIMSRLFK